MANISLLYVDTSFSLSFNFWHSKVMGLSFCKSCAPRTNPKESHTSMKGGVKLGVVSIDVQARAYVKLSKACCVLVDQ
jgi:hypothetical protein